MQLVVYNDEHILIISTRLLYISINLWFPEVSRISFFRERYRCGKRNKSHSSRAHSPPNRHTETMRGKKKETLSLTPTRSGVKWGLGICGAYHAVCTCCGACECCTNALCAVAKRINSIHSCMSYSLYRQPFARYFSNIVMMK